MKIYWNIKIRNKFKGQVHIAIQYQLKFNNNLVKALNSNNNQKIIISTMMFKYMILLHKILDSVKIWLLVKVDAVIFKYVKLKRIITKLSKFLKIIKIYAKNLIMISKSMQINFLHKKCKW